jgi:branched-chain amino acid aminotransferase
MKEEISYLDGEFLKNSEAKISPFDLGFTRSYAVFEFLRTYNLKPFLLDDHLKRLFFSARILGIKHKFTKDFIKKIIFKLLEKNKNLNSELNLRIFLTGGESKNFLFSSKPKLYIIVTKLKPIPEKFYLKGIKIITKNFHRDFPQAKSVNYSILIKYLKEAKRKGAFEVLLVNNEEILECATSNFFAIIKGKIITPPKEKILEGITRKYLISLIKKYKFPFEERKIFIKEIKNFDEAFITATNKEILPVVKLDNLKISKGKPGEITLKLLEIFRKEINERY